MSKLVVLFPGIGYHCDKPLLFYGRMVAQEAGYDECIKLDYSYSGENIRGDEEKMKQVFASLFVQADTQLKNVDFSKYDEVLFVAKSIGTIIAAQYAKKYVLNNVRQIWYTPLKYTFGFAPCNAVAFIGDMDPWSHIEEIKDCSQRTDITLHIYEGTNHSLEDLDVIHNLDRLKDVMVKTKEYIAENR